MSIGTMLFNPFTGKPRDPRDIASDPAGVLVWDGETPLRAQAKNLADKLTDTLRRLSETESALRSIACVPDWDGLERARSIARDAISLKAA